MADKFFVYLSRTARFFRGAQGLAWALADRGADVITIEANREPRPHKISTIPFLVVERAARVIYAHRVDGISDIDAGVLLADGGALTAESLDISAGVAQTVIDEAAQMEAEEAAIRAAEVATMDRYIEEVRKSVMEESAKVAVIGIIRKQLGRCFLEPEVKV